MGKLIMKAAADSNLKKVTLELGGEDEGNLVGFLETLFTSKVEKVLILANLSLSKESRPW